MPTTAAKNMLYRFLLPFCSPRPEKHPVISVIGRDLACLSSYERLIRKHHIFGSAMLISDGRQTSKAFSSSLPPFPAAAEDTFYRVASITKMATAVLTMHFADQHLLDPDCPVSDYLPPLPQGSGVENITLRHLLSHTSGLTDPPGLESALKQGIPFYEITKKARLSEPGIGFHYSNLGFGLIGCVLESVLNSPVGKIYDDYLFRPLHMNATLEGCCLRREKIMPVVRILPYHRNSGVVLTQLGSLPLETPDPLRHYGHTAGSMYSDLDALFRLIDVLMHNNDHYLSDSALNEIRKMHASYGAVSPTLSYGLGLLIIRDDTLSQGRILGHQGFAYGCADGAFWDESTGNVLIMLNGGCSESRTGRLGSANYDLMRWAFRKELPSWL